MKKKTKHWTYRGETKPVSYRLPITTINKLDKIAKDMDVSKAQVLIEAIDEKEEAASK